MERRQFFRLGMGKALEGLLQWADNKNGPTGNWFRPPYALAEAAFLRACTRCDHCITACPHEVLFALPARLGNQVAGTPAMDLLNRGCHLCADWPCVQVCEPNALRLPSETETAQLRLARVDIDPAHCLPYRGPECGACGSICPVPGALFWDGPRPSIVAELCVGCALCREACITTPKAVVAQLLSESSRA